MERLILAYNENDSLANEELFKKFGSSFIALEADEASLEETIKALSKATAMFLNVVTPDYGEFDKMTVAIGKLGNEMDKLQNAIMQAPDNNEDTIKKIYNSLEEISVGINKIVNITEKNIKSTGQKESTKNPEYSADAKKVGGDDKKGGSKGAWNLDSISLFVFFTAVNLCGIFLIVKYAV